MLRYNHSVAPRTGRAVLVFTLAQTVSIGNCKSICREPKQCASSRTCRSSQYNLTHMYLGAQCCGQTAVRRLEISSQRPPEQILTSEKCTENNNST